MFKKIMKHLTNNMGLKFLSVLFSVILWLVVVNIADPEGIQTFSVPVDIQNKEVIEQMGKVPDVIGDTNIAVFYITGPRSYVEDMDAEDFNVTADLSQLDLTSGDEKKLVRIEVTPKKYAKYIKVHQKTVNMQIALEELAEKNFVISPVTTGTPADGCAIGAVEVTPNLLAVSGPESIVSKISKVTATINVNGISSDVIDSVTPVLYDEEGNVISSDLLETNQSLVNIEAKILGTKQLTIQCDVTGEPADGYEYKGLEYAPQTITVKGEAGVLNITNVIMIPQDVMNIEGATGNVENTIDIEKYLPQGVSLVDEEVNQVAIKALIVKKETKVFNFPTEKIKVNGLPNNYEITYDADVTPITVRASKEDIENFSVENIQATMDVSDLEPGTHTIQLELTINDEKYEIVGSISVEITIKDKNEVIETGGDSSNSNSDSDEDGVTDGTSDDNSNNNENSNENGNEGNNSDSERE